MSHESFVYCNSGARFHTFLGNKPFCPCCNSQNVIEQGYDHNHRHHCNDCKTTYWITYPVIEMKEIFAITGEQLEKLAAFGDVGCERDIVAVIMEVKKQKLDPSTKYGD